MIASKLDLNLLRVFDRLMQTRSVTGAARQLGLTQSTVSAALNRLRETTGDRLLERLGNSMVPTRTATAIWPDIRAAIRMIEESLAQLESFEPIRATGTVRIGFDEYAFIVLGQALLQAFRNAAPQIHVEILPVTLPSSENALNAGTIDMAIGASWTAFPGLKVEPVFKEEFTCLVDMGHPEIRKSPTLDTYLAFPHLLVSTVGEVAGNVDSALVRIGRQRRIGVTVPYLLAAPRLLTGSDMIFNTGRRLAKLFSAWYQARVVEPPIPIPGFTVAMVWHPRNSQSRQHQWLRDQVLAIGRRMRIHEQGLQGQQRRRERVAAATKSSKGGESRASDRVRARDSSFSLARR